MTDHKGILIFGETLNDTLSGTAKEILGCGRKLSDILAEEVTIILFGKDLNKAAQEAIAYGADTVYKANVSRLDEIGSDFYIPDIEKIAKQVQPRIFLMSQTATGSNIAPRLAYRLNTAVTTDCIELGFDKDSGLLQQTRPVYGGNALAIFTSELHPQMSVLRPKVFSPIQPDSSRQGNIIEIESITSEIKDKPKILKRVIQKSDGFRLEDAPVIVTGGRGIGSIEGFKQLEELATILKGAVGASRPPCDNGWVPNSVQIGLTGKIVAPALYFAVALSGSSQHVSGCSGSKNIIAVNKDPEANIFNVARFGIVGDWKKIIPALTDEIKKRLAE
ncbi:MAG: electron transfer flavoprotein subunit alpha/FixB family protein [Dehalococcoidales bacterium]|nr:electron transfer flavoprotein subunit alpha/FixB family protein [Dehalococcoidales bacterium]